MKKSLLTFHLLCIAALCQAQWAYTGNVAHYSGNVGVNTTAPSNTGGWDRVLDVRGGTNAKIIATTENEAYRVGLYAHTTWNGGGGLVGTETNHPLFFMTNNSAKMMLDASGNLAIGHSTAYSHARLHIKAGWGSPWGIMAEANGNGDLVAMGHDGTAGYVSVSFVNSGGFTPLFLRTSNLVRMAISVDGNVGVGTANPLHRLDVNESKPGDALRLRLWNNTTNTAGTESRIDLPVYNGNSGLSIRSMGTSNAGGFNVGTYDGWMHTGQIASYLHFSAGDAMNQNVKHLTIKPNGFVGIGTSNPDKRLTVKGAIHTEEVIVDMLVPGPDYVFEKDYELLPLAELEAYINQNKHLPEVPSAKEMEANGLKLREMNLLLLKKVEELTLHLIDQNHEIKKVSDENQALKERISKLESKK